MGTQAATLLTLLLGSIIVPILEVTTALSSPSTSAPHECDSIDVRNVCESLSQLEGCTVIKGFLIVVLLPKDNSTLETCKFASYRYPLLREITDYLLFFDVKGLTSIRDLFPNLTVIRGRRLFLNYALGVTNMPDLEMLEFKSLVAIQRGHVFIGSCPKLCHLEMINWDRLTLSPGENHIFPVNPQNCPSKSECKGCDSGYCWSNAVCQKFENDNVINLRQRTHHCHEECLGGCYNSTDRGCVVCKNLYDHGACVRDCPPDEYLSEHYQRCYTKSECVNELFQYTHGFSCVSECPGGFKADDNSDCIPCLESDSCIKECSTQDAKDQQVISIYNLEDAEHLRDCQVINASLVVALRNRVDEVQLTLFLRSIREIRGHLKISRSPHLTSLKFLQNLQVIQGDPLENDVYALIIYDNQKLQELWQPKHMELARGGMYVHLNNKLCNRLLREFREQVIHDKGSDSLQTSDQEVLCGPQKLLLQIEVLSHHNLRLSWSKEQTAEEVEVLYRPIHNGETFTEQSELDSNVCTRISWERQLVFRSELRGNDTHYNYIIRGLTPNTKYACLVKTFGADDMKDARSELKYATTKLDIPLPPPIVISRKTDSSFTLQLKPSNGTLEAITHYALEWYELPDDVQFLDKRNYCNQPALLYQDISWDEYATVNRNEEFDDCCERQAETAEDRHFVQRMREEFSCSLDRQEYCVSSTGTPATDGLVQALRLESNLSSYTLHHLERFRLYVLQLQACNEVGCSSYSMHSERTNYSIAGDKLDDLQACRVPSSDEYRVYFSEPKHPNSVIVSYVIHYRIYTPTSDPYQSHIKCVTRVQHANANYEFITHLNSSFNQVAVRVHSLAGDIFTGWINVSVCPIGSMTKIAGFGVVGVSDSEHSHGLNVFLVFFLLGAGGTFVWVCYKRRYWRKCSELRRFLPLQRNWRVLVVRPESSMEDRQILVDGFETVRFHNNSDDDQKYLE